MPERHTSFTHEDKAKLGEASPTPANDQPYASELDARELEHAHREKRPVEPDAKAVRKDSDA